MACLSWIALNLNQIECIPLCLTALAAELTAALAEAELRPPWHQMHDGDRSALHRIGCQQEMDEFQALFAIKPPWQD